MWRFNLAKWALACNPFWGVALFNGLWIELHTHAWSTRLLRFIIYRYHAHWFLWQRIRRYQLLTLRHQPNYRLPNVFTLSARALLCYRMRFRLKHLIVDRKPDRRFHPTYSIDYSPGCSVWMKGDKIPANLGSDQLPCLVIRHLCFSFVMFLGWDMTSMCSLTWQATFNLVKMSWIFNWAFHSKGDVVTAQWHTREKAESIRSKDNTQIGIYDI